VGTIKDGEREQSLADLIGKELAGIENYRELHWEGTFHDYLKRVQEHPLVIRTSYQRLYDMIVSHGTESRGDEKPPRYKFFEDPFTGGRDAIFGLEDPLGRIVDFLKSAAYGYGQEKRILLMHGPVGSAKSTVARLMKRGLEHYSRTPEGALYTFSWKDIDSKDAWRQCQMHEEPLNLLPAKMRDALLGKLNSRHDRGYDLIAPCELCPDCSHHFDHYMREFRGDFDRLLKEDVVRVERFLISEKKRLGIGTFQPKDEKNQDSTELTGDINYAKIAKYGRDSDPRAFNFDGEFCVGNRGLVEFIEVLKLDVAFLYDLLGASQEHSIKPKKFSQTDIDLVIVAHTNEPEYKRLQSNELMEAFRDRTIRHDVPYNLVLDNEIRIYERDYGKTRVKDRHIAPHTLELAAMWAVATRLEKAKDGNLSVLQKLKLYNGKTLPGYGEDILKELREEATREGLEGISPRYIQDKISNALVKAGQKGCVNPFMALNELEDGLKHHSLISDELRVRYKELLALIKEEYDETVKNEVQKAIVADEDAIGRLFGNYVDNVKAFTQKQKVKNKFTGKDEEPDERLMRSIEEKMDIPESRKEDFRREIMGHIGALATEGKRFNYRSNERLQKALEAKLWDDQKDTIRLSSLATGIPDKDAQEKIDIVKGRLVRTHGYCDTCASNVLQYVASIFARKEEA
jgi:serine protein kinase